MQERVIAGLSCRAVLAVLPDYLDGSLSDDVRQAVDSHLAGCDGCTKFGGRYATVVRLLRAEPAATADRAVRQRLRDRLGLE
jgi:anti-sigma factor RsiW